MTNGGPFFNFTGLDSAGSMKPGTSIDRIYFVTPGHYTVSATGVEHDTLLDALREAARLHREKYTKHAESMNASVPLPPEVRVDVRWVLSNGTDMVAQRLTYHSVIHAEHHIDNIVRYSPIGA